MTLQQPFDLLIIGGGAAGFFAAIQTCEHNPNAKVAILEATRRVLTKVRVSGGGRCNVTHSCFEPKELVKFYPRGSKELLQAFSRFQPKDTVAWFHKHGVELHTEADGRMFPTTNSSQTIIDCLTGQASHHSIDVMLGKLVRSVQKMEEVFVVETADKNIYHAKNIMLASGSFLQGYELAKQLGHTIADLVPSLFTFVIKDDRLTPCPGVSFQHVHTKLSVGGKTFEQRGPMLVTHWGLSGPCVLKLSAWAARELFESHYRAELKIDFFPDEKIDINNVLDEYKKQHPLRTVFNYPPLPFPQRFWEQVVRTAGGEENLKYAELRKDVRQKIANQLRQATFVIEGKGEFKEEFVTCGGVARPEIDFKRMESRLCSGLYFAGEVVDIDGVTGGFNFQNAWTGGFLIGQAIGSRS